MQTQGLMSLQKGLKIELSSFEIISNEFIKYDKDLIVERLRKEKIACGVLNSIEDLEKHPQLRKIKCTIGDQEVELIAPPSIVLGEEDNLIKIFKSRRKLNKYKRRI